MMQSGSLAEQLAELDAFAKKELSQSQRDVNEVRVLIRQTAGEVERLSQRHGQSMAKQREIEANLDGFNRSEIKQILTTASENQLRLFVMQSQMEQLQTRQRSLEKIIEALQRIVEVTASAEMFASEFRPAVVMPIPTAPAPVNAASDAINRRQSISRIIQAQEEERNRVARQIHDGPAQALTNVVLRAEICERLLGVDPARARVELGQLKELVTSTLGDTRRFIFDVRPMILDDLGLLPTLKKYAEAIEEKGKLTVDLSIMGQEQRFESQIETIIFRIIQEALRNVVDHANAGKVRVDVSVENGRMNIVVEDDGVGFDVDAVLDNAREHKGKALGIANMLERVEMLGGQIDFESAPEQGTRLVVSLPLPD